MQPRTSSRRLALNAALVVAVCVGSFVLTRRVLATRPRQETDQVQTRAPVGPELLAIFVASSGCGASRYPGLHEALTALREKLRLDARRADRRFVSVGVAIDQDPTSGENFLKGFGPFDEILSGGGWLNTGSIVFLIRDVPGPMAIPQLVVIERNVALANAVAVPSVTDRVIGRTIGGAGIVALAQSAKAGSS
jgi:hypothetical protein